MPLRLERRAETSAVLQIGATEATQIPNVRATQQALYQGLVATSTNGWPSVNNDMMGILGKGLWDYSQAKKELEIGRAFAEKMAASMQRALSVSFDGWIDDDLAFVQKFGFNLGAIDKPVVIWQGDDDFMVPQEHSRWLHRHINGSELKFVPGHGHISLGQEYRPHIIKEAIDFLGA